MDSAVGRGLLRFFAGGWGFDWVYDRVFVGPFVWFAKANKGDFVDWTYRLTAGVVRATHYVAALTQSGRLRWYAANMAAGLVVLLLLVAGWL